MIRKRTTTLAAAAVVLLGGCAEAEPAAPSIEDQTVGSDEGGDDVAADDGSDPVAAGTQVQQGTLMTLGDVRVGVYSSAEGVRAQLSLQTPDEVVENAELRVGEELEVGGYTVTLTEAGRTFARVLVVDPDGVEVTR